MHSKRNGESSDLFCDFPALLLRIEPVSWFELKEEGIYYVVTYEELYKNVVIGGNNLVEVVICQNNNVRRLRDARDDGERENESENSLHSDERTELGVNCVEVRD